MNILEMAMAAKMSGGNGSGLTKLPEGYPYKEVTRGEEWLAETTLQATRTDVTLPDFFTNGNLYAVVFDGEEYICTAAERKLTTDLFTVMTSEGSWGELQSQVRVNDGNTHTIAVYAMAETYYPLDENYIPETIARTADVQEKICSVKLSDTMKVIGGGTANFGNSVAWYDSPFKFELVSGREYRLSFDGNDYGFATAKQYDISTIQVVFLGEVTFRYYPATGLCKVKSTSTGEHDMMLSGYVDVVSTIDPKFIPKASAVADVTAAPTADEFNALLASLRAAGYLAT